MINKYKFKDSGNEFICYSNNEIKFPEDLPIELIESDINPAEHTDIPILNFEGLMYRSIYQRARTIDKVLGENNCETFNQLSAAYFLIKNINIHITTSVLIIPLYSLKINIIKQI
jgi:hypothetical protein